MSLILPGSPAFTACSDNIAGGTVSASNTGTNFTAGANNADGTAVSVLSALGHDVHYIAIAIAGINQSGGDAQCLLDVLVDPAGGTSWASLIDDLVCGFTPAVSATLGFSLIYHFPLFVKSGSSIGVQARTAHTADITSGQVAIYAFGNPRHPSMWWCGCKVESLGINAGSSKGTNITPGNGAFGSWTSIGGTTSGRYGALQFGINGTDATAAAFGNIWQIGAGSSQLAGTPTFYSALTTSELGARNFALPIWCDVPSGTQLQMRGKSNGAGEVHNAAIYGVH